MRLPWIVFPDADGPEITTPLLELPETWLPPVPADGPPLPTGTPIRLSLPYTTIPLPALPVTRLPAMVASSPEMVMPAPPLPVIVLPVIWTELAVT